MKASLYFLLLLFPFEIYSQTDLEPKSITDSSELKHVSFDGTVLHYIEQAIDEPVVLIHGSLADYSYWENSIQIKPLAENHHVFAYSRLRTESVRIGIWPFTPQMVIDSADHLVPDTRTEENLLRNDKT